MSPHATVLQAPSPGCDQVEICLLFLVSTEKGQIRAQLMRGAGVTAAGDPVLAVAESVTCKAWLSSMSC